MAKGKPLTDRQRQTLRHLVRFRERFVAPLDIGGYNGSHHSNTLTILVKRGLVERKRRHVGYSSGSWTYRITPAGRDALAGG